MAARPARLSSASWATAWSRFTASTSITRCSTATRRPSCWMHTRAPSSCEAWWHSRMGLGLRRCLRCATSSSCGRGAGARRSTSGGSSKSCVPLTSSQAKTPRLASSGRPCATPRAWRSSGRRRSRRCAKKASRGPLWRSARPRSSTRASPPMRRDWMGWRKRRRMSRRPSAATPRCSTPTPTASKPSSRGWPGSTPSSASTAARAAAAAPAARRYAEVLDSDPNRLEAIESRLAVLDTIKRKYGGSIEGALEELSRLERQVGATADLEGAVAAATAEQDARRADLEAAAVRLTRARTAGARRMKDAVAGELQGLRLEGARFDVALRGQPEIGAAGAEVAEMMFSANPGEPLAPLARVASGGELARVMLAIKTVGADADRLPTLVFDEVDAGIGGEAAIQVGLRLKKLGERHQVLVVTHLAQIASFADHHLVVEKSPAKDGRNVVTVRELAGQEERARELARMMSGGVTAKAVARAHELLEEARA